jgi:hypothetical protein
MTKYLIKKMFGFTIGEEKKECDRTTKVKTCIMWVSLFPPA